MKVAVCDSRIYPSALSELGKYCDRVVTLPSFDALDYPVSAHADMLVFPCREKRSIITHGALKEKITELFGFTDYSIIAIPEKVSASYPGDILLNAAVVGDHLFARLPHISSRILEIADELGLSQKDVKQGYAKCSVCTVTENALITADPSISKVAGSCGIDVLDISPRGVSLPGYDCGFIGGASGTDGENIFFCGDVFSHPDGERIAEFCQKHGKNPVSLSADSLLDIGTIFFL